MTSLHRDLEDAEAKARRVVRTNNFTQQTNALDVDKHMYVPLRWRRHVWLNYVKDGVH